MHIVIRLRERLLVALLALAAVVLLAAGCGNDSSGGDKTPAVGQTPAVGRTPAGATAAIKMLPGTTFDTDELRIPASTAVEITADNTDGFHSFAVFESQDAAESGEDPIAETEACSAPCKKTVEVTLAAGEHFFRCAVHPTQMTGTLTAE